MSTVADELREFGEKGMSFRSCCTFDIIQGQYSSTFVFRGREGESYNAILEYYDDRDIFLKRHRYNSTDVNLFHTILPVECRKLLLVYISRVQRFVWGQQFTWNDMEKVADVGHMLPGLDLFTDGTKQI